MRVTIELEQEILELREVLFDDKVAMYCIENNIDWSDTAMAGSPVEVVGLATDLIKSFLKEVANED